ncbi:Isochorismatase-like protein [Pelagophyceae sp. CCMP2097]|nr:Isochorismatase-like protein [Pelagophyceae sp. CCMP2097]
MAVFGDNSVTAPRGPLEVDRGVALLIIDPQQDFHAGGSLAIPGADADAARVASFLEAHRDVIDTVCVTLDSHHAMHIANVTFWEDAAGVQPKPFTAIAADDVRSGKWRARQPELRGEAFAYVKQLEACGSKFQLVAWPEHCLIGSPGHSVVEPLLSELQRWARSRRRSVTWVMKGVNTMTEMYSCFSAEVPRQDDKQTQLNTALIEHLARHSRVVCCGQAKSHCVNHSVRDLVRAWPHASREAVMVLSDATSTVPGFEAHSADFERDMADAGVTFCTAAAWAPA